MRSNTGSLSKRLSTIWQQFATGVKLSRLLTALFVLAALKIGIMFFLGMDFSDWDTKPTPVKAQAAREVQAATDATAAPEGKPKATKASAPAAEQAEPMSAQALRQKQDDLLRREQALNALEKELDAKLQRLTSLEHQIKGMLEQADVLKDNKVKHLIEVYSNMKAKQAADVLGTIEEEVAVKILAGMKGKQAGEILNFVEPQKAARLSVALTKMQTPFQN